MTEQPRSFEGRDLYAELTTALSEQIENLLGLQRWLLEDEGKTAAEIASALEAERSCLHEEWLPAQRARYLAEFKAGMI